MSEATTPSTLLGSTDPTDPYARMAETFPRLSDEQVERVASFGTVQDLPAGTVLFARDDRGVDFFLVLEGSIEIYDTAPDGSSSVFTVHEDRQFTGELDLFNDRAVLVGGRTGVDSRVARLTRQQFRRMLAAEPDVAERVMCAFILRREGFVAHGQAAVTVVGSPRDPLAVRIQAFLSRNNHPYVLVDSESDTDRAEADRLLEPRGLDLAQTPVVLHDELTLVRPSTGELADALGISEPLDPQAVVDVVVVGGGPAGLAAGVYAASEGLDTVVLEAEAPGGQAGTSSRIENYLGFPAGISGQALASRAEAQAQRFGAHIAVPRRVERLDATSSPYTLTLDDGTTVRSRAVVVATGARYRSLEQVEGIERYEGNGVHYAATAVEAALCVGEEAVVVGGGNSAGQAAVFLSRWASHVHVLVRGDGLAAGMSDYLVGQLEASAERITVHPRTEVTAIDGDRHLDRVTWTDRRSGEEETHQVAALFLMLGAVPSTEWLRDVVALDEDGFVCTGDAVGAGLLETSRRGVFAVGDVRAGSVKRVASAVGEGSIVVASVHQHLAATSRS